MHFDMEENRLYIEGERLFLQELSSEDITDSMMLWFEDMDLMRFYTNSGKSINKATLIQSIIDGKREANNYTLGIFLVDTKQIIGTVKIGPINKKHQISDLATLIGDRSYLGKGYSTEAIRLGVRLAFDKLNIRRLYGGMYYSNKASINTYLRAGWIVEGRLKGYYLVNGQPEDRLLVGCYNPAYFSEKDIEELKKREPLYYER